jgi:branched-chain amino acid transport system ATP-binding protein
MLVEIRNITVHYRKSLAIENVSVNVPAGGIVSIIGANGAGKSTILKALVGLVSPTGGEIYFDGKKISGLATASIVQKGIALVPEGRQLFPYLSVLTNLKLGATLRKDRQGINDSMERVFQLFPRLKERVKQDAGTLSGGEQQMLAIGRGLMAGPRLLCMDEPSLGLAPIVVEQVGEVIREINAQGITVLLVEQNMHLALNVAKQGYVLKVGRIVLDGDIASIKNSDVVKEAYLGG